MRRLLGLGLLVVLAASAGCSTVFGPGSFDRATLAGDANTTYAYDWTTNRTAFLALNEGSYTAVYAVSNRTTGNMEGNYSIELYTRDALGTEQPLPIEAVRFRYANGTVLRYAQPDRDVRLLKVYPNGTTVPADGGLAVEKTRKRTVVYIPTNRSGKLAYTAPKNGKRVSTPTFVRGSYEMILPEKARVGIPVLAQVQPPQDEVTMIDNRVHIVWTEVTRARAVIVRYYLERDLLIFGSLVVALVILGSIGTGYYWLQIRETVRRREEVGLDVETDDDGRDPPPGMG